MNSQAIRSMLAGSGRRLLILDSNLPILWITARYDLRLLATFKRVQMFSQDDAVLLAWTIDQFKSVVTTAHVVTEASNLGNSLSYNTRMGWFAFLAEFASNTEEQTHSLKSLAAYDEFIRFGTTDCALFALSDTFQVLTTDRRLSNLAEDAGKSILNFDDLRRVI